MIVAKAVKMARMMGIPVIGLVENMSYFECPDCDKKHYLFGESRIEEVANQYGIEVVAKMPIDSSLAGACDKGLIELFENNWLDHIVEILEKGEKVDELFSPELFGHDTPNHEGSRVQ